jgi:esterase/lipase superfamily enzyme
MKIRFSYILTVGLTATSLLWNGCVHKEFRETHASTVQREDNGATHAEWKSGREAEESRRLAEAQEDQARMEAEKGARHEYEKQSKTSAKAVATEYPDGAVYPVWFGTNRKPIIGTKGLGFTAELNDRTTYGCVDVFVPNSHRFGETGTGFLTRLLRGDPRDDTLFVQQVQSLNRDALYLEIRRAIQAGVEAGNESQALVFLHGFNVTFEEAAIRAAQVGFDLKLPGPTAFFSWPSLGSPAPGAYRADEKSIVASEAAITDFLVEFSRKSGATNINLIAHSMGNRGLLSALQRIAANADLGGQVKFNQIILAAPDVGRDDFVKIAGVYSRLARHTTLYTSNGDLPVYLSTIINKGPRAGYFKPFTVVPGVDTVAVPDFNIDMLGHSYFAQAEALIYDIRSLMLHDEGPGSRLRISPVTEDGLVFWKLGR